MIIQNKNNHIYLTSHIILSMKHASIKSHGYGSEFLFFITFLSSTNGELYIIIISMALTAPLLNSETSFNSIFFPHNISISYIIYYF